MYRACKFLSKCFIDGPVALEAGHAFEAGSDNMQGEVETPRRFAVPGVARTLVHKLNDFGCQRGQQLVADGFHELRGR